MKCFLVTDTAGNKIIKVQEEDIVGFRQEYAGRILLEAGSIQDLLIQLSSELEHNKDFPDLLR